MKSSSSLLLLCIAIFIFPFLLRAENNDYNRYRRQLKEKLGIELSVPDSSFEFVSGPFGDYETMPSDIIDYSKGHILSFGDNHPLLGCAAYLFGPTVKLNEHCRVAMMDIENVSKPRPLHRPAPHDYTFAQTSSWMLNNCGEPWAFFYIYDIRGVRDDNAVRPSPEELRAMQEKTDSLRAKYERCVEDGDIVEKTNCDRVFIVRIPDIEKIGTNPDFAPFLSTEYRCPAFCLYLFQRIRSPMPRPHRKLFSPGCTPPSVSARAKLYTSGCGSPGTARCVSAML